MNKIGVVTVTYGSGSIIDAFLESTFSQTDSDFVLYLIDNASTDDTLARVGRVSDSRIRVTASKNNLGIAEGNNLGIRQAIDDGCTQILLINNDTEFPSNLFSALREALDTVPCDMVVPKILYHDSRLLWAAGGFFIRPFGITHHYGDGERDNGQFDHPKRVEYSPTCCMLIRKEVFDRVGMMDANYFVYYDDTDFCLRASRANISLYYWPYVTLTHKVSSLSGGHLSDFGLKINSRNHAYFILKNYPVYLWPLYLIGAQIFFLGKLARGKENFQTFLLRQRHFLKGFALYRQVRTAQRAVSS